MKIGAIIQARMGSTRLPGKVIKKIDGKTVLGHVIERVKKSNKIDKIIVATSNLPQDDVIEVEALRCGVEIFRGSEGDVLSRFYYAAEKNKLDVIIRITSDCPLIDAKVIDDIINFYLENNFNIVSNAGAVESSRTYPRGLDTEVFSFKELETAFNNATENYQREHVTPYIYENSDSISYFKNDKDYSKYRWTLDTEDDFRLINKIYKHLYNGKHDFYMEDIIRVFEKSPQLYDINSHVEQKKIK